MTSDELLAELKLRMGNRKDIDTRLKVWLNAAYFQIGVKYRFRELEKVKEMTTISGTREYDKPPTAYAVRSLRDMTNKRFLGYRHWMSLERLTPSSNKPTKWARHGGLLILDPTPNGAYVIRARITERPMALTYPGNDTVSPITPVEWDEALILKAMFIGHNALLEKAKAADANEVYKMYVAELGEVEYVEDGDLEETLGVKG